LISKSEIVLYNYVQDYKTSIFEFSNELNRQPDFVEFNQEQNKALVSAVDDILFINMKTKLEIDIDEKFSIRAIKACLFHEGQYFVLSNKFENKLGYFLLKFDYKTFTGNQPPNYLMKWKNKLELADAGL
tara:strand:+ start:304 stop:693 length:390 start_codon:yes stop_codon:yes gene_type:complete